MKQRHSYTALIAISSIALIISVVIFPFFKPLSLMFYFNREYDKAFNRYEEIYQTGDRSISTIIPLVLLNLQYANTREAIFLLQDYVKENPRAADVLNYLGKIYLSADRPYSYLETLPKVYALAPTLENIRNQATLYGYYGQREKQIHALQTLVDKYKGYQSEYQTLAYLYAADGQQEKSLHVVAKLLNAYPIKLLERASATLSISLLIDSKQEKKASQLAVNFVKAHPTAENASDIASLLQGRGLLDEALAVLDALPGEKLADAEALAVKTTILVDEGRTKQAYRELKSFYDQGKLPDELYEELVTFGLMQEKKPESLEKIIQGPHVPSLSDAVLLKALEKAYRKKAPGLALNIEKSLPSERLQENPVLSLALEIGEGKPLSQNDLVFYMHPSLSKLDDAQKFELAKLYNMLKLNELSKEALISIRSYNNIPDDELIDLANLMVDYDLTEEGLKKFAEAKKELAYPQAQMETAWFVLFEGTGNDEESAKWLAEHLAGLDPSSLEIITRIALNKKAPKTAYLAAESLLRKKRTVRTKSLFAEALVLNGKPEDGLKILRRLIADGKNARQIYLASLAMAYKQDPRYRDEFTNFAENLLAQPSISRKQKREIGYALVDAGLKQEALGVFFDLAGARPFDDPDVQALIGLFGEKLSSKELAYVENRALFANGREKGKWLVLLNDTGNPKSVVAAVGKKDLDEVAVADPYLEALVQLKEDLRLADFFEEFVPKESGIDRLKKFGKIATEESLDRYGEEIYMKILASRPYEKEGLRELGILYFSNGAFSYARSFLDLYLEFYPSDFLTNYYYAELLRLKCDPDSCWFYGKALWQAQESEDKETETSRKLVEAQSFYRLKLVYAAIDLYWSLLYDNPNSKEIRTDFADLLLDLQYLSAARYVLFSESSVPAKDTPKGIKDRKDEAYLETAKVKYYQESLELPEAFCYSDWTLYEYPDIANVYVSRASLEQSIGRWRMALKYLDSALCLEPQNENTYKTANDTINEQRPYLFFDREYRQTGKLQYEKFCRAAAAYHPELYSKINFLLERDWLVVKDFQKTDGETINFRGFRERARLFWTYDFLSGDTVTSLLYASKAIFGGGLYYRALDYYGFWDIGGDLRSPNWDFTQTTIERGSLDRAFLGRTLRIAPLLEASLLAEYRHYNLQGVNGAAQSIVVRGYLNKALSKHSWLIRTLGEDSSVILTYNLDAEYPFAIRMRTAPDGTRFAPLPVIRREEHSLFVSVGKIFCQRYRFRAHGGYVYDRYGTINKASPIYGAELSYIKRPGLNWTFLYDHSQSNENTSNTVDRYLINVSYFY